MEETGESGSARASVQSVRRRSRICCRRSSRRWWDGWNAAAAPPPPPTEQRPSRFRFYRRRRRRSWRIDASSGIAGRWPSVPGSPWIRPLAFVHAAQISRLPDSLARLARLARLAHGSRSSCDNGRTARPIGNSARLPVAGYGLSVFRRIGSSRLPQPARSVRLRPTQSRRGRPLVSGPAGHALQPATETCQRNVPQRLSVASLPTVDSAPIDVTSAAPSPNRFSSAGKNDTRAVKKRQCY